MLSKINRLTKKKDFEVIFTSGKTIKDGLLLYRILPNHLPESRFGFVVSKKVSLKATVRNKVRRQLRQAVQNSFVKDQKPTDIIIIALPGIQKQDFSLLQKSVAGVLQKIS